MRARNNARIKGISVSNPVDVEKDYLLYTVDYAARLGFDHIQVIGPIHDGVKGNIDGMTPYRKYSHFNHTKNPDYVNQSIDAVNAACEKAVSLGIRMYQWHHELDLPDGFKEAFPEVVNSFGDVEVTHPLVKDFLENKIVDFFHTYPNMDGIILTLHETKIPLLKLKDQKLGRVDRVKYVTKILFDTCKSLGKELIVRPFASIEEDYVMMAKAYEEISSDLLIMDKWTQFDWSLTLPHNAFYTKIQKNPLFVEADIFGEFFGKGRLPLMLKEHIAQKFTYCETFSPKGYVARIDRGGQTPFGDVNEVNNYIMHAHLNHEDVEKRINGFFEDNYPEAAEEVRALMEPTEEILKKTIYTKGYYFSELSRFPTLNHCKNHFYFEMMREHCDIASNEWFIPKNWERGELISLLEEKEWAVKEAQKLCERLLLLQSRVEEKKYEKLWVKFTNLKLVTQIWKQLVIIFMDYVKYFETFEEAWAEKLQGDLDALLALKTEGSCLLGDVFYCLQGDDDHGQSNHGVPKDYIGEFIEEIRQSFALEKEAILSVGKDTTLVDVIVCGGAMEGHRLQKEVNFSDTLVKDGELCRIPGNRRGMEWSSINAHGWFSYELRVSPQKENRICVVIGSAGKQLDVKITVGEEEFVIREKACGKKELVLPYTAGETDRVRIRFDKISGNTPCVYLVKVY